MGTLVRTSQAATKRVCGSQPSGYVQRPVVVKHKNIVPVSASVPSSRNPFLNSASSGQMLSTTSVKGVAVTSRRLVHTDVTFPKFHENERAKATDDASRPARETEDYRRSIAQGSLFGVSGAVYLYMATKMVQTLVIYKSMPADELAMANTEIDLNEIPEGQCKTYSWRGKPFFIFHRTQEDIEKAKNVKLSELRDPQTDEDRVKKDEWLITIGVCPHLGCVPLAGKGEYGGFYCPCHGSTFDTSGRIRFGPAPSNLEVPPYRITEENRLIVGD